MSRYFASAFRIPLALHTAEPSFYHTNIIHAFRYVLFFARPQCVYTVSPGESGSASSVMTHSGVQSYVLC